MKNILCSLLLIISFPLFANSPANPIDVPVLASYRQSTEEITRQAVRLGYQNFQIRLNTPEMTLSDRHIAIFITIRFQPFFDKLNQLENVSEQEKNVLVSQYNDEFADLIAQFSKLLLNNQRHYSNPLFLNDQIALQETLQIVQEAISRGSF